MRIKSDAVREKDQHIGNRVRYLRQEADMTLLEVAEAISMSVQTISKYETGEISISVDRAEALAKVFGVKAVDIIGWRQEAPQAPVMAPQATAPWYVFEVPRPPSINSFKRSRHTGQPLGNSGSNVASWTARANACLMAAGRYPRIKGPFEIGVIFPLSEFNTGSVHDYDNHNYFKALFDWLEAVEMIENDKLARRGTWDLSSLVAERMMRIQVRAWVDNDIPRQ